MYNINEILVCLDNSYMDEQLISYTKKLSGILNPVSIYFLHVREEDNSIDHLQDQLKDIVDAHFATDEIHTEVVIRKGIVPDELVAFAKDKDVELVVVGNKRNHLKKNSLTETISHKAPCSLVVVPEQAEQQINNVLLPVDFSSYSRMALEEAREFTKKLPHAKISALILYEVPASYYNWGKDYNEAAEIMKHNKEVYCLQYLKEINAEDMAVQYHYKLKRDNHDANEIYEFAVENKPDLIIIGSRGKTKASAFLLGSTTNELLRLNDQIPMMVLKKKGEHFDIIDALLKL